MCSTTSLLHFHMEVDNDNLAYIMHFQHGVNDCNGLIDFLKETFYTVSYALKSFKVLGKRYKDLRSGNTFFKHI